MFEKPIKYQSKHVILTNLSHAAGGFGVAILLQQYYVGNAFLPAVVGWLLLAFTLVTHYVAWTSK